MLVKFYEKALENIRERKSVFSGRILSGSFETLDEYKLIVGKFKGLEEAEILLQELYGNIMNLDRKGMEDEIKARLYETEFH